MEHGNLGQINGKSSQFVPAQHVLISLITNKPMEIMDFFDLFHKFLRLVNRSGLTNVHSVPLHRVLIVLLRRLPVVGWGWENTHNLPPANPGPGRGWDDA